MTVPKGEKCSCVRARWITVLLLIVFLVDIIILMGVVLLITLLFVLFSSIWSGENNNHYPSISCLDYDAKLHNHICT